MDQSDPLVDAGERFEAATEQLNQYITKTEGFLQEFAVTRGSVRLPFDSETEPHVHLSWRRHEKEWKLCLVYTTGPEDSEDAVPLLQASLEHRILAVKAFDQLVERLVVKTNRITDEIVSLLPGSAA